ncbi:MAG: CDP-diacylglycerol--glycerol-3-phosphate 3-phosphatidyltransferase [[Lactobacillus] timonensis]|uniref:CDP-diacylglycerol--glycerol-3-phosphate 3-phosphatidyltransferase n=1 Tax=[Lactobacillus] timonensis TaxID=1970790 RepID=UPI000C83C939|nr:CDP-diacylglycerol--glycerol-3-phosphate 3-phosphatidyltransferase [[Lactobacillus] timonensis]MCI1287783.1 CDP-diacylglycerol--glycerol-3-phosphate 3-phosphatidyltransferase [[Lactobacillus] timonensis]MCI1926273.1 CDP-diacylglycerol--glycerol-3-phosphate 3-phosphatidyltransferase [[Lactobacillus] timonensis]MCI1957637.1 CDP-diacylglycerol--glycerol-3-phosphate 3-phosphatidyltransferase [[Lactobacillus] timonensis]MCI1970655.1 CDP-diacylglycerol--glycerol-3-phosphate 3-phosphatidyltransfera
MNLPNKLTVVRLIIIPFFLCLMVLPLAGWGTVSFGGATVTVARLIATILFIAATITDNLDGRIARSQHLVTNFGKFADPLADKLLVMTAFVVLTADGTVPAWVTAIILWRELAVTGLRLLLVEQDGIVLAAKMPGKIKTTTQFIAIIFLLLHNAFFALVHIPFGEIMLYICLFFTVYSGIDYFYQGRDVFSDGFK